MGRNGYLACMLRFGTRLAAIGLTLIAFVASSAVRAQADSLLKSMEEMDKETHAYNQLSDDETSLGLIKQD